MSKEPTTRPPIINNGTVNADEPWPGLLSYNEVDQAFFRGRHPETKALHHLVTREMLTVLFGLSGLGKTSLLQAGLFPRLRQENVLPVYIRLDFSAVNPDPVAQIKMAMAREVAANGVEAPVAKDGETLWEYFHRKEADFWNRRNRLMLPLLVFDQFEEIFTLGRSDATRTAASEVLVTELVDLVEGRPPAAIKTRLDQHPEKAGDFSFGRHYYRVLLSLREEFLPELEELSDRISSIAFNRLRLRRMNGEAALRVVNQATHLVDPEVAERVVRFVAAEAQRESPLADLEVEPALLSVVCRELNNKRRQRNESHITLDLLQGSQEAILTDFYERSVFDLNPQVRSFVEEQLLTVSGFRNSVALEDALSVPGVSRESIDRLVSRRLIRIEERVGVPRLELAHDRLTTMIRDSRDHRHRREAIYAEKQAENNKSRFKLQAERASKASAILEHARALAELLDAKRDETWEETLKAGLMALIDTAEEERSHADVRSKDIAEFAQGENKILGRFKEEDLRQILLGEMSPLLERILFLPEDLADVQDLKDLLSGEATLTRRSAGESVIRALQRLLIFLGYSTSVSGAFVVDGHFSHGTNRGVAQFLVEHRLTRSINRNTLGYPCRWNTAETLITAIPDVRLTSAALEKMMGIAVHRSEAGQVMTGRFDDAIFHLNALDKGQYLNCRQIMDRYGDMSQAASSKLLDETGKLVRLEWILAIIKQEAGGIFRPRFEQHYLSRLNKNHPAVDLAELRMQSMSMGLAQIMGANYKRVGAASATELFTAPAERQVEFVARFLASKADVVAKTNPSEQDFRQLARYYNGSQYEVHHYHDSLAGWHREFRALMS